VHCSRPFVIRRGFFAGLRNEPAALARVRISYNVIRLSIVRLRHAFEEPLRNARPLSTPRSVITANKLFAVSTLRDIRKRGKPPREREGEGDERRGRKRGTSRTCIFCAGYRIYLNRYAISMLRALINTRRSQIRKQVFPSRRRFGKPRLRPFKCRLNAERNQRDDSHRKSNGFSGISDECRKLIPNELTRHSGASLFREEDQFGIFGGKRAYSLTPSRSSAPESSQIRTRRTISLIREINNPKCERFQLGCTR